MNINQSHCNMLFVLLIVCVGLVRSDVFPYDILVCFGDSATDTGNTYNLTGQRWPSSLYYSGRFSNGPVWVDRLNISNLVNYAYGGATTDNNLVIDPTSNINTAAPGVRQQIILYRNKTDTSKVMFFRTLYAVWIGANDYFYDMTLNASTVVKSITNGINDLIGIGVKKFLILNQPPFQLYPATFRLNMSTFLNTLTIQHNGNLSDSIEILRQKYPDISFYLLDVYSLIQEIAANSLKFGITNLTNCWSAYNITTTPPCTNASSYLFIDEFHFTTRVHQLIADRARTLLSTSNGVILSPFRLNIIVLALILLKNLS